MSILGAVLRTRPEDLPAICAALAELPGVEIARRPPDAPEDGRLVLLLEDSPGRSAAGLLAEIAGWPRVHSTSLVYEYSGPDAPPPAGAEVSRFEDWRGLPPDPGHPAR